MALNFQETDSIFGGTPTNPSGLCSGFVKGLSEIGQDMSVGGTPGTSTPSALIAASSADNVMILFDATPGSGVSWDAGTWTVRFNVSTANMNVTWDSVFICRADSTNTNQETLGSATGLAVNLGTTGVKSTTVSGSAATSPAATDTLWVLFVCSNSAMTNQTFNIKPDQIISSPFTASPASVSYPEGAYIIVSRMRSW